LWAVGTLFTLVTIALLVALLVVNLGAVKWENLSRERIAQVALFIGIAVAATTLIVLLAIGGASLGWTGFQGKTVWDFLQLLIVPLMLVAIGLVFSLQQDARQQRVEEQRADAERELAERRAQDEALQAYLNQMSNLLLENDLRESKEDSEVRTLARARTLTVLGRLDPNHKTALMQFLVEADLVQRVDGRDPIISLGGADLNNADLPEDAIMPGAVLSQANLSDATLRFAYLSNANLYDADLSNANLSGATLSNATLRFAKLSNAFLSNAFLSNAMLSGANLSGANLTYANLRAARLGGYANLSEANLSGANLRGANLAYADLRGADLSDDVLRPLDLRGADLSRADLSGAEGITNDELQKQAKTLEGATMPNGQKYEEWLKSKENGKNE
jgi:uncharacterized protein YjbI with pentapeptide repeats